MALIINYLQENSAIKTSTELLPKRLKLCHQHHWKSGPFWIRKL